jgi:hypothetical protein
MAKEVLGTALPYDNSITGYAVPFPGAPSTPGYAPPFPGAASSSGNPFDVAPYAANINQATAAGLANIPAPVRRVPDATVAYSASQNKLFVNGYTFDADNETEALNSLSKVNSGQRTPLPPGDWKPVALDSYLGHVKQIADPGMWRLASRNFGIGVDNMQLLAGRGLQFLGAEQTGKSVVDQQLQDLSKTQPYQREFTDIGTKGQDLGYGVKAADKGAFDWFVANLAQQGPNMIETIVTATVGGLVGSAAGGGPVTGVGGALMALAGKQSFKSAVIAAAKKHAAGEALDAGEEKLLREATGLYASALVKNPANTLYGGRKGLMSAEQFALEANAPVVMGAAKTQAKVGGAAIATGLQNYATGVADVYGEGVDSGNPDRATAAALGIPYALLETLPEFLLGMRVFGGVGASTKALADIPTRSGKAIELLKRGTKGAAVGGGSEGFTEAGQEALLLSVNPNVDWNSPEGIKRLTNAFAAGFAVGGPLGGASNLFGKKGIDNKVETDILKPGSDPSPTASTSLTVIPPVMPAGGGTVISPLSPQTPPGGGGTTLALPSNPSGIDPNAPGTVVAGNEILPSGPGTQSVLPIFGNEPVSTQELTQRMSPTVAPVSPTPQTQVQVPNPNQLELFPAGQENVQNITQNNAQNNAQNLLQNAPVGTQLDMFGPASIPTSNTLASVQQEIEQIKQEEAQAQQLLPKGQAQLFNLRGQPTVLATRQAKLKRGVIQPVQNIGTPVVTPTVKQPTLKKGAANATQKGKQQQSNILQRQQDNAGVQGGGQTGNQPTTQVKRGSAQASGSGKSLQRGAKQEVVTPTPKAITLKKTLPTSTKPVQKQKVERPTYDTPEAAWEDMRPENNTKALNMLPAEQQKIWKDAVSKNTASMKLAEQVTEDSMSPNEIIAEEISAADSSKSLLDFKDAMVTVVNYAWFNTNANIVNRGPKEKALLYINTTDFSAEQRKIIDSVFLEEVNGLPELEAMYKSGTNKGTVKPWFAYAEMRGLINKIDDFELRVSNKPTAYKTSISAAPETVNAKVKTTSQDNRFAEKVEEKINDVFGFIYDLKANNLEKFTAEVEALWKQARVNGQTEFFSQSRGKKLKEFFTADGKLKVFKNANGSYSITTKEYTEEQRNAEQKRQREAQAALQEELNDAAIEKIIKEANENESYSSDTFESWDKDSGEFYRDDNTSIGMPMSIGKIQLLARTFLARFKFRPNLFVYKNIADLKANNPNLFKEANAARTEGDFESTNAAGYSFKNNVIIFSDFIKTDKQLKFILAHETLGHFGFKAIMNPMQLKSMLNNIYNSDHRIRSAVDMLMETQGLGKLEAIEELLADHAAELDVSIIARVWNTIKNALNTIGISFDDDLARMVVNQARKYLRSGNGEFNSPSSIVNTWKRLSEESAGGRYYDSILDRHNQGSKFAQSIGLSFRRSGLGGAISGSANVFNDPAIQREIKSKYGSFKDFVGRVLETVQSLDNKASRSEGLSQVFNLLQKRNNDAYALQTKYANMTTLSHQADFLGGVSEEDKLLAGEFLAHAAIYKNQGFNEADMKKFSNLFSVDTYGNIMFDSLEFERIKQAGFVSAEEFRRGFTYKTSDGEEIRVQYDIDENSNVWKMYVEQRNTVAEAAKDILMSNYESSVYETNLVQSYIANITGKDNTVFDAEDILAFRRIMRTYADLYMENAALQNSAYVPNVNSIKNADLFLKEVTRALYEDKKVDDWLTANPDEAASKFQDERFKPIIASLKKLNEKGLTQTQAQKIQGVISNMQMLESQVTDAELYAKRTILSSYVPLKRRGRYQVKLSAYDARGNIVRLSESFGGSLPYYRVDSESDRDGITSELQALFGNQEYVVENEDGQEVTVTFKAEGSVARQTPDLSELINYNDFVIALNRFNINLNPTERQRIVQGLTRQNSNARSSLMRSGNPGWDKDVLRGIAEFLETASHVAAAKVTSRRISNTINNSNLWLGNPSKLKELKRAVETASTPNAKRMAQREYDEYAYMYKYMRPQDTVEINGKTEKTLGRGEDYREEAKRVVRWQSENLDIANSTEDFLSTYGSDFKLWTVLLQLGGSMATALINTVSLVTHSWTYMSSYNHTRGFGLGFGAGKSGSALWQAMRDIKNGNFSESAFIEQILKDNSYGKYNLTKDETEFLLDQTLKGTLQAAQFNSLLGTARGKVNSNRMAAGIKAWMYMFSYTEQLNRRTTALATYRLEKVRALASGYTEQEAKASALKNAQKAVNTSQGEYAMYNRPEMARGNVMQYLFMYKQFAIISVQLLKGLSPSGRTAFIAMLILMSGVKGIPFADDLMDLADTLMQKFGIKRASVEKSLIELFDTVAPGSSPVVMRGVLDTLTGATFSTRLGSGDLIPLTGAFKGGADPMRELQNFAGPVVGAITGVFGMGASLIRYGGETVGILPDVTSISGILRESPIALARALGDSWTYYQDGAISTPQGKIVSSNVSPTLILSRALGFYPAIATKENDIVRIGKAISGYQTDVRMAFTSAYVKAAIANDTERMQEIIAQVNEWNQDAAGTGLDLRNFGRNSARAVREAKRPTAIRYLKTAPRNVRPEIRDLMDMYGITDEDLYGN